MSDTLVTKKTCKAKRGISTRMRELVAGRKVMGKDLMIQINTSDDHELSTLLDEFWKGPSRYGNKRRYEAVMKRADRKCRLLKAERQAFRTEEVS